MMFHVSFFLRAHRDNDTQNSQSVHYLMGGPVYSLGLSDGGEQSMSNRGNPKVQKYLFTKLYLGNCVSLEHVTRMLRDKTKKEGKIFERT